jgi:hypothetical protein
MKMLINDVGIMNMNERQAVVRWGRMTWGAIALLLLGGFIIVIGLSFIKARHATAENYILNEMRRQQFKEERKKIQSEQVSPEFDPVKIVSATSALLPEYRTTRTNANNQMQNIGTNAPNSDL